MAGKKQPTHVVNHNRYFASGSDGKLQHIKKGTPLTLTEKQAGKLGNKVLAMGAADSVDMTGASGNEPTVSDAADKLAQEKDIDLSLVTGTGANGSITKGDVEKYIADNS
jgi:pyruvate/2-oxoglutarate dehydrogenase complex dihydrolipoamide acyltransferase (E2) component